ncbi:MAG: hypothetical protein ACI8W3_001241 [Myxococcota bacterium]|jgi:hypothetical protein
MTERPKRADRKPDTRDHSADLAIHRSDVAKSQGRGWLGGYRDAPASPAPPAPVPVPAVIPSQVPERYGVRESEDGMFLHCDDAPRVRVQINPKLTFSEADARAMGGRAIFLDGAGDFPPKLDNKTRFYNLDHHQGCIRPFTLATCEQALVLVMNGLEMDEGDWTLYANEPDLDTMFAIWVLLNFRRIPKLSSRSKDVLLPLLRLEGAIDANGSELADYCGLTQNTLREARARLDTLYTKEKEYRTKERWADLDARAYAAAMLGEIDQLVYTRSDFQDHTSIEEILGHVEIADRKVAVACRDQSGIYEAERSLKNRFADQLGIIALEKSQEDETRHYTLRRVSAILNFDLEPAYDLLNLVDPAVDGRPAGNRWGGSLDIGGSPRTSGTRLAPNEVLRILQQAYQHRTKRTRLWPWFAATTLTTGLLLLGTIAAFVASTIPEWRTGLFSSVTAGGAGLIALSLVALLFAAPTTWNASNRRPWMFGWRTPAGHDWLYLYPLVMFSAVPANAWVPRGLAPDTAGIATGLLIATLAAVACEGWFRGVVHGWFLFQGPIQRVAGPWMLSRAASVSTFLYMVVYIAAALSWNITDATPFPMGALDVGIVAAAALVGGAALAMIRERSMSLWPAIGAQVIAAAFATALAFGGVSLF